MIARPTMVSNIAKATVPTAPLTPDGTPPRRITPLPGTALIQVQKQALSNPAGIALSSDGLRVDGTMFCRHGFTAQGEVRLPGARIGGRLFSMVPSSATPAAGRSLPRG